ncbi:UV radiation resistance-associated gene protein-like [Uloborus diversus]|uniref:UV radiation resistance-associated gene protein-like n=1 Tax=Uloborus diversus TaxID=327109 RepID=UPI00240A2B8E|nr:UV radiation resistance-associated gene protein-like [Uloborus diversus]
MSPSWKDFESSNFPENVDTASPHVTVKVWRATEKRQLLIEWMVFFSGLVFLGEQIPKEGKNFKPNTLIFGMSEGYYGCNDCYQHATGGLVEACRKETLSVDAAGLRTSCTLSTLSRIKTVERAIKQTLAAVQRRRDGIEAHLSDERRVQEVLARRELHGIRISVLRGELLAHRHRVACMELEIADRKEHLRERRRIMEQKLVEGIAKRCGEISKSYCELRESLLKVEAQLNLRRKQLISELSCIYPIVEFPDGNGFSVHSVYLPDSERFGGHDETMIAIALGYVCHIVLMIAHFLNIPLRYAIHFYGSRSTIFDHISCSLPDKTREFPLFSKGKDRRCFEYGVFLLNKNIAQLRIYSGLTTRDLSAMLPNLHSLFKLRFSINSDPLPEIQPSKSPRNGPTGVEVSDSEIEVLKREVEAMMPPKQPALERLGAPLGGSLDDVRLLEQSKNKGRNRLTSHHSSHPNLNNHLLVRKENPKEVASSPKESVFYVLPADDGSRPTGEMEDFPTDAGLHMKNLQTTSDEETLLPR